MQAGLLQRRATTVPVVSGMYSNASLEVPRWSEAGWVVSPLHSRGSASLFRTRMAVICPQRLQLRRLCASRRYRDKKGEKGTYNFQNKEGKFHVHLRQRRCFSAAVGAQSCIGAPWPHYSLGRKC